MVLFFPWLTRFSGIEKKSPFLTIQFWPQFDFGHRTLKSDIFDHPTIKTIQI